MDGALLQSRIYHGYKQAARHAGRAYSQYRFTSPLNPTDAGNLVGSVDCLFAADAKFSVPVKYKIPDRYLYADGSVIAPRDILIGPYGTFYVASMQPNVPIQVVRCNDLVTIRRTTYVGIVQTPVVVVSAMPAFKQLKKIEQKSVSGIGGATNAATAVGEWFLFLPIASGVLLQGDIVTDENGKPYTLDTIDNTEDGIVLTIRQADG